MGWFSEIATSVDKIFVNSLNFHEIRYETLDYTGDSETVGDFIIGEPRFLHNLPTHLFYSCKKRRFVYSFWLC